MRKVPETTSLGKRACLAVSRLLFPFDYDKNKIKKKEKFEAHYGMFGAVTNILLTSTGEGLVNFSKKRSYSFFLI